MSVPISVVAMSKVCMVSNTGIVGLNPARDMGARPGFLFRVVVCCVGREAFQCADTLSKMSYQNV